MKIEAVEALGLYISVPFCRSKCSFCNFASGVYPASQHTRYVERVCEELKLARVNADRIGAELPALVDSIYLGGGTPSVLEPALLRQIFITVHEHFQVDAEAEITMECAPGQIDDAVLAAMVACGVNRVSLGVQSFIDVEASATGRLHNREMALRDIYRLSEAGLGNLSVDLIAGLPHQSLASWEASLRVLVETQVEHASIYMLEVDDDSRLGKEMLLGGPRYHAGAVPNDDTIATMFEVATDTLASAGLKQYEISNHAVAGKESKHNLKYWTRQPYLGIGLDAHSMLGRHNDLRGPSGTLRFRSTTALDGFLEGRQDAASHWLDVDRLTDVAALEESWFLGLRLNGGVDLGGLRSTFGSKAVERFLPLLVTLEEDGFLTRSGNRVMLTPRGRLLSNEVFAQILNVQLEGEPQVPLEVVQLEAGEKELCPQN